VDLGECDLACNFRILPAERRLVDVICQLFQPCPVAFYIPPNCRKFVADDLVRNQRLAEGMPLVRVVERQRKAGPRLAIAADRHDEALLVEVGHDDAEALVFLAEEIFDRHVNIIHFDKAGAAGLLPAVRYPTVSDTFRICGDDDDGYAVRSGASSSYGCRYVGCPWHAGDPLLVPIHNIMLSIRGLHGCGLDVGDVRLGLSARFMTKGHQSLHRHLAP